jgi:hypothetical protein
MSKVETKSTVLLKHHLKALRLPTMHGECEKVARRCAAEDVDHLGFLLQLCELELIERERRAAGRRLKAARFPSPKALVNVGGRVQRPASEMGDTRYPGYWPDGPASMGCGGDPAADRPRLLASRSL